jgi:predicted branched-subunit amino acid permease
MSRRPGRAPAFALAFLACAWRPPLRERDGCDTTRIVSLSDRTTVSSAAAFGDGLKAASTSIFIYTLFGNYIGFGALAHDLGFTLGWAMLSTVLIWAAPAQVILVSALGGGGALIEAAAAVALSAVRLLPMVVAMLPQLKGPDVRARHLLLPAHFTAVSMWVEALRLLPAQPRERRIAFCNGLGTGFTLSAVTATGLGFYLAGMLPVLFAAALLFLTPMGFMVMVARNSRLLVDRLAFALGLVLAPALASAKVELDLLWTGIIGGTFAYALHRLREATR